MQLAEAVRVDLGIVRDLGGPERVAMRRARRVIRRSVPLVRVVVAGLGVVVGGGVVVW